MSKPSVRCRCGHYVLAKEVLRTDLYERPSGRNYVYIKFRCRRCKRLGQAFVPEGSWDWSLFEPAKNEMSESERERFATQAPVTVGEILDFHCSLEATGGLTDIGWAMPEPSAATPEDRPGRPERVGGELSTKGKDSKAEVAPLETRRARTDDSAYSSNSKNPAKNAGDDNNSAEDFPPSAQK